MMMSDPVVQVCLATALVWCFLFEILGLALEVADLTLNCVNILIACTWLVFATISSFLQRVLMYMWYGMPFLWFAPHLLGSILVLLWILPRSAHSSSGRLVRFGTAVAFGLVIGQILFVCMKLADSYMRSGTFPGKGNAPLMGLLAVVVAGAWAEHAALQRGRALRPTLAMLAGLTLVAYILEYQFDASNIALRQYTYVSGLLVRTQ